MSMQDLEAVMFFGEMFYNSTENDGGTLNTWRIVVVDTKWDTARTPYVLYCFRRRNWTTNKTSWTGRNSTSKGTVRKAKWIRLVTKFRRFVPERESESQDARKTIKNKKPKKFRHNQE